MTPLKAGVIAGVLAALAEPILSVASPPAYGICMACHTRDLVNWLFIKATAVEIGVAPVSSEIPVLTLVGVMLGSYVAAKAHGEVKLRVTKPGPFKAFLLGFVIMISALLAGACPIRLSLRTAYVDIVAFCGIAALATGIILGVEVVKHLAERRSM